MPGPEWIDTLDSLGLVGGCALAVWAFMTDRVVTGKTLTRIQAEWQKRIDDAGGECRSRVDRLEAKLDDSTDQLRSTVAEQSKTIALLEAMQRREAERP